MALYLSLRLSRQYARVKEQPEVLGRNCQLTEMLVPVTAILGIQYTAKKWE
jgi:hypothetical protein